MVGGSARVSGQHVRQDSSPGARQHGSLRSFWEMRGIHTVFKDVIHLRRLLHLRLAGPTVAHDVLPSLRIGKDELVGRDPDHLAVLAVQLENVEGQPARHEAIAVADARCAHPERARELAQRVEEYVITDMAQEIADELGAGPLGLAAGYIPGLRDGGREFYPPARGGLAYRERGYREQAAQAQARGVDPYDRHDGVLGVGSSEAWSYLWDPIVELRPN